MKERILVLSMIIMLITISISSAQEFVTDGLIAMWTLDAADTNGDKVKDVSGKGNDATMMGSLKSIKGVIGECYQFEGKAENYIAIPKMGSFDTISVECWAMEDQFGDIQGIVSTWQWEAGKVHFKFESNQIQVDKNGGGKIVFAAEAGKWYHIVYTTDTKANKHSLYVNGAFASDGPGGADKEKFDERRIGSEHDGRWLRGKIDEVRVYNRVLTENEINKNFKAKSNKTAVEKSGKASTCWGVLKTDI